MRLSLFSSKQCIIKQLLDSVFVISGIIKVSVSVISLSLRLRLITLTSTLIIPDITKTSSNNCLESWNFAPKVKTVLNVWGGGGEQLGGEGKYFFCVKHSRGSMDCLGESSSICWRWTTEVQRLTRLQTLAMGKVTQQVDIWLISSCMPRTADSPSVKIDVDGGVNKELLMSVLDVKLRR